MFSSGGRSAGGTQNIAMNHPDHPRTSHRGTCFEMHPTAHEQRADRVDPEGPDPAWVLLAGESYGVAWPPGVHRITGHVLLPPTASPLGPLSWIHAPQPDALRLSREIGILAAVRTALTDPSTASLIKVRN